MASFNTAILLGNLTRDPQMTYTADQTPIASFGFASNRKWKTKAGEEREDVLFIDCTAFGRQAEVLNEHCQKGKQLLIDGRLKLDQWDDKQTGEKRSKIVLIVENFQMLGSPGGAGDGSNERPAARPQAARGATTPPPRRGGPAARGAPARPAGRQARGAPAQQEAPFGDEEQFRDDDIPF